MLLHISVYEKKKIVDDSLDTKFTEKSFFFAYLRIFQTVMEFLAIVYHIFGIFRRL